MSQFNNIGLIGRLHSPAVVETLHRVLACLSLANEKNPQQAGRQIWVDERISDSLDDVDHCVGQYTAGDIHLLGQQCDLVIVVGGDGSMLSAARVMATYGVPMIGINRGKLGFLTDIAPDQVEASLTQVLAGEYEVSDRFMLSAHVLRNGTEIGRGSGLNDVVLHPGQSARMLAFDITIDGAPAYFARADGLIIATPTGSTAYALSAGGPIMHPSLDAIALVPMNPHNLSSRPLVVSADAELELHIGDDNGAQPIISCDGQEHIVCEPGDQVLIRRHEARLSVLHPLGHHFYQRCRSKLGWHGRANEDG
ncbi:MAG TPA: NAD(+) kinase [Oceanospirillaceae bacterium]|nr:NAD(+) kinase [Oceanospirillaceae bacterium]